MDRPPLQDEVLGELAWDSELKWWMGRTELVPGHPIEVYASPEAETGEFSVALARQAFLRVRAEDKRFRRESARWVLEDYNGCWNKTGRDLSVAGYVRRLRLETVELRADGSAKLSYNDGGLFRGHSIGVWVAPDGKVQRAVMGG
jgi:hypothetical protein